MEVLICTLMVTGLATGMLTVMATGMATGMANLTGFAAKPSPPPGESFRQQPLTQKTPPNQSLPRRSRCHLSESSLVRMTGLRR
jgi:hypothetical protein